MAKKEASLPLLEEAPGKRPVCGTLALVFGVAALGLSLLGSLLYLTFWFSLDVGGKVSVIIGASGYPGTGKLLLPVLMNYLAVVAALASLALGSASLFLEKVKRSGVFGIILASSAVLILFAFWLWTVTRNPEFFRDLPI
jgi:hypothetical protein